MVEIVLERRLMINFNRLETKVITGDSLRDAQQKYSNFIASDEYGQWQVKETRFWEGR